MNSLEQRYDRYSPTLDLGRTVYGTGETIPPDLNVSYRERQLNGHPIPQDQRRFHQLLVALSSEEKGVPHALLQRYGLDPYKRYCTPESTTEVDSQLQEAMRNAVLMLLWEKDIDIPEERTSILDAA